MRQGTFRLPTIGRLVRYRARSKRVIGIGIVLSFEPKDMIEGATRIQWSSGKRQWVRWSSAFEIIA